MGHFAGGKARTRQSRAFVIVNGSQRELPPIAEYLVCPIRVKADITTGRPAPPWGWDYMVSREGNRDQWNGKPG